MSIPRVLTICLFALSLGVPCLATIELNLEHSFGVAGLDSAIQAIKFADVDGDYFPEALASDGISLVLWDITGDSARFSTSLTTGFVVYDIHLGDVNRDSIVDIIVGYNRAGGQPSRSRIVVFDGSHDFAESSFVEFPIDDHLEITINSSTHHVALLRTIDFDGDGYTELLFSYDAPYTWEVWGGGGNHTEIRGATVLFHSFPDSIERESDRLIGDLQHLLTYDDEECYLAQVCFFYGYASSFLENTVTDDIVMALFHESGTLGSAWPQPHDALVCTGNSVVDREYSSPLCLGDVDTSRTGTEVIAHYIRDYSCSIFGFDFDSTLWIYRAEEWTVYNVLSPNNITLVQRYTTPGESLDNFVYLPDFPGYFFAFHNGAFTQFNGTDWSINQSTTAAPSGKRHWDAPLPDGKPRLVVTEDRDVRLYGPDIVTGLNDGIAEITPESFVLSQPYPNPFNPEVSFSVRLTHRANLRVDVYNTLGRRVATVRSGPTHAGETRLSWDGSGYASGVYFIKAITGNESRTAKAVLLK